MELIIAAGLALVLGFGLGVWVGYAQGAEAAEEAASHDAALDPPDRTPGLPTNADAEPSVVRAPRYRAGRMRLDPKDNDPHQP